MLGIYNFHLSSVNSQDDLFSLVKDETLLAYQKSVVKRKRGRIGLSELRMYVYDRGLSYVCDIKNRMDCSEPTEVGARNQP